MSTHKSDHESAEVSTDAFIVLFIFIIAGFIWQHEDGRTNRFAVEKDLLVSLQDAIKVADWKRDHIERKLDSIKGEVLCLQRDIGELALEIHKPVTSPAADYSIHPAKSDCSYHRVGAVGTDGSRVTGRTPDPDVPMIDPRLFPEAELPPICDQDLVEAFDRKSNTTKP